MKGNRVMSVIIYGEERCVMCGQVIPEGRMVCPTCEMKVQEQKTQSRLVAQKSRGFKVPLFRKRQRTVKAEIFPQDII